MKFCPQCQATLAPRHIDSSERLACSSTNCGFVFWANPTPVAAGLVIHDGKFLLARNAQWPLGMYSVITGFVEKGELPEETMIREVAEELGLTVASLNFIGHFSLDQSNQLLVAYVVQANGQLALSDEIIETLCLSKAKLAKFDFGPMGLTAEIVSRALLMPALHHA